MLLDSQSDVFTKANIKFASAALQYIHPVEVRHPEKRKLVAGAGFEPAAFRL
jgi:hypothetical protein